MSRKDMLPKFSKIKGIHPGAILRRELKIRNLKGNELALRINEHKQTISAILNKRRNINPKLSIKLAKQFNVEEDYFMLLQSSFDVKATASADFNKTPDLNNIRRAIFWDTNFDKIDWMKHKRAVIKRVLERGNSKEINEIISFYGKEVISKEIRFIQESHLHSFKENIVKYNLA